MLEQMLGALPKNSDPRVLVGTETADDAGVYQLTDDLAVINTVDYFTPIVDDPFTFGAIAMANALSDVYSMGGTPRTALNILLWDPSLPAEVLGEVVRGGSDALRRARCALVGGHSVEADELMYGGAITGTVHPNEIVRNCSARPGDRLVLTKPLGVGILTTAAKSDLIGPDEVQCAVDSMLQLNDVASIVMREFGAHAATDVTGFGLLGHGYELAKGSGLALEVYANRVPMFDAVLPLIERDTYTRASRTNREFLADHLRFADDVSQAQQQALLEAETSGGLLIAFPPQSVNGALDALRSRGCDHAAIIGEAVEGRPGEIRILS